jgi:hypothetical protein
VYSFKKSGQPGKVTRVMCCTPEEKEKYLSERKEMLELMDTHIAPSFTVHPRTKDMCAPPARRPPAPRWEQLRWPERCVPQA